MIYVFWNPVKVPFPKKTELQQWEDNFEWGPGDQYTCIGNVREYNQFVGKKKITSADSIVVLESFKDNPDKEAIAKLFYANTESIPETYNQNWRAKNPTILPPAAGLASGTLVTMTKEGLVKPWEANSGQTLLGVVTKDGNISTEAQMVRDRMVVPEKKQTGFGALGVAFNARMPEGPKPDTIILNPVVWANLQEAIAEMKAEEEEAKKAEAAKWEPEPIQTRTRRFRSEEPALAGVPTQSVRKKFREE